MDERWALLSDVHGNLPALRIALSHAREAGAGRIAFLGDALGGTDDESCCRLLMSEAAVAVFGNREVRVRLPFPRDIQEWIKALPASQELDGLLLCHSSPASLFPAEITAGEAVAFKRGRSFFDLFPYISGRPAALAAVNALAGKQVQAVVHGHTHRQMIWSVRDGESVRLDKEPERKVVLGETPVVIGIGSVGEGEKGRVEYALYDSGERTFRLQSIERG